MTVIGPQGPAILGSGIIGGTIDNVLIDAPSGPGILLSSTTGFVTISGVTTDDTSGAGLEIASGSPSATVFGLTVNNSLGDGVLVNSATSTTVVFNSVNITNAGGAGMVFDEVDGTVFINSSSVSGSFFENLYLQNTTTTPPIGLNITGSSFDGSTFGSGLALQNFGGDVSLTFDGGSASSNNTSEGIFIDARGGTTDVTIQNGTQFTGQNFGFRALHSATTSSTVDVDIDGATFDFQNASAIEFDGTSSSFNVQFLITVHNTTINGPSDNGISMTHTEDQRLEALLENNTISGQGQFGIWVQSGILSGDQPTSNVTLLNNMITESALNPGIRLDNQFGSTMCLDLRLNAVGPTNGIEVNQSSTGLVSVERLNGGSGSVSTASIIESFILGENPSTAAVTVNNTSSFLGVPSSSCPLP